MPVPSARFFGFDWPAGGRANQTQRTENTEELARTAGWLLGLACAGRRFLHAELLTLGFTFRWNTYTKPYFIRVFVPVLYLHKGLLLLGFSCWRHIYAKAYVY